MKIVLFNNEFVEAEKVNFSVFSPSVMYGRGVFETLRTYNKKVFCLADHVDRLKESARTMKLPISYSQEQIAQQVEQVVEKSGLQNQRIKIAVFEEGVLISSTELHIDEVIYQGVSAVFYPLVRSLPEVKGTFYAPCMLAHEYAVEQNVYESILFDPITKHISEGAWSNIFWVKNGELYTTEDGILKGITRKTVIELSAGAVKYGTITTDELFQVDEVFLTQTTKGIVPITQIEGKKIGSGKHGLFTQKLIKQFHESLTR